MPNVTEQLIDRMKYFIPASLVKHQIRLYTTPKDHATETAATVFAAMPRQIMRAHMPVLFESALLADTITRKVSEARTNFHLVDELNNFGPGSTSCVKRLHDRQPFIQVCDLIQDHSLGFRYPSWRTAKFAKEIKPEWLIGDGKAVYDYCLANDLRPTFSRLTDAYVPGESKFKCSLIIRWQGAHFDNLLKLQKHPLFAYLWQSTPLGSADHFSGKLDLAKLLEQADTAVATEAAIAVACTEQFHKDMDEECAEAAKPYIARAVAAIAEGVSKGKKSAIIFTGGEGQAAFNCFGEQLKTRRQGGFLSHFSDYRLFDRPGCWSGVVARGLCLWAQDQGLVVDIRLCEPFPSIPQLDLSVSWANK